MGLIFLSYQQKQQKTAAKLRDALKSSGYETSLDKDDKGSVEKAAVVIMCMSASYKASEDCKKEVDLAKKLKKPIISISVEVGFKPSEWLEFGSKTVIDFSDPKNFKEKFQQLLKELAAKKIKPNADGKKKRKKKDEGDAEDNEEKDDGSGDKENDAGGEDHEEEVDGGGSGENGEGGEDQKEKADGNDGGENGEGGEDQKEEADGSGGGENGVGGENNAEVGCFGCGANGEGDAANEEVGCLGFGANGEGGENNETLFGCLGGGVNAEGGENNEDVAGGICRWLRLCFCIFRWLRANVVIRD